VRGHNMPHRSWYKDACNLVNNAGVAPRRENPASWVSKAFEGLSLRFARVGKARVSPCHRSPMLL